MGKRNGFTLVELLVVIAVIALLMAVLLPALTKAKELARATVCRANLKQWGIIISIYAENNNGFLWSGLSGPGISGNGYYWIGQLDEKNRDYKNNKIWFCPNARKPRYDENGNLTGERNVFGAWGIEYVPITTGTSAPTVPVAGSYGINGYLLNTQNINPSLGGSTVDNWRNINVKGASEIPMFLDAIRYDGWPKDNEAPAQSEDVAWTAAPNNSMIRFCVNRHRGFLNCVFSDTHVRKVGLKELWTFKWHRNFRTNNTFTKAGSPGGHVDPAVWPEWIRGYPDY